MSPIGNARIEESTHITILELCFSNKIEFDNYFQNIIGKSQ